MTPTEPRPGVGTPRRYHEVTDAEATAILRRLTGPEPPRRVLLRGAVVISMDAAVGDLAAGDVLIENSRTP
jgi:hypothetical protein